MSRAALSNTTLLGLLLALLAGNGCLAIGSASFSTLSPDDLPLRQAAAALVAVAAYFAAALTPFRLVESTAAWLAAAALAVLSLTLAFGVRLNGMRGWLDAGFFTVQPSEIAKPFFALGIAAILARGPAAPGPLAVAKAAAAAVPFVAAIALEPDIGTAALFVAGLLAACWLSGARVRHVAILAVLAAAAACATLTANPRAAARVGSHLLPDGGPGGWHAAQMRKAMAAGGLAGRGPAEWAGRPSFLPLPHSDSAFSSLVEATGFAGGAAVAALGALALAAALATAARAPRAPPVGRLFAGTFTCMAGVQGMLHIAVNLGAIPPTGLPLPFASHGGSCLVATCLGVGMAVSALRGGPAADRLARNPKHM